MILSQIYTKYKIPPNLARHQLEVAAVGKYVCDHWTGPKIDGDLVVKTLLLHDLGNIVKFKRPFLGELEALGAYWERVQAEFIARYGNDATEATYLIVSELGLTQIHDLLVQMKDVWEKPDKAVRWEARIAEFADTCVTPIGIEGFEIRMKDLAARYGHTEDMTVFQAMKQNAYLVQENVDTDLRQMSKIDYKKIFEELRTVTF